MLAISYIYEHFWEVYKFLLYCGGHIEWAAGELEKLMENIIGLLMERADLKPVIHK
jgi:hypothetical protein